MAHTKNKLHKYIKFGKQVSNKGHYLGQHENVKARVENIDQNGVNNFPVPASYCNSNTSWANFASTSSSALK